MQIFVSFDELWRNFLEIFITSLLDLKGFYILYIDLDFSLYPQIFFLVNLSLSFPEVIQSCFKLYLSRNK